jgi:Domain of unknown function (DUF4382)
MNPTTPLKTPWPALLFAGLLACGSSGNGTMNVHLVDGPGEAYDSVTLQVKKVEIHGAAGWITLADFTATPPGVKQIDNLLALTRGVKATLVDRYGLPAGHYDQMRLLLGSENTVTPAGSVPQPLKVPSGMQSGLKFAVSFDVQPDTTKDVFIDFDAHRSIFVHSAGNSGQYLLRPVVRAVDRIVTGAITGTVTGLAQPFTNVTVTAQTFDGSRPVVVRTVPLAADGSYVLDLLPVEATYHVVAAPVLGTTVYTPKASAAKVVSVAAPVVAAEPIAFTSTDIVSAVGAIQGSITPSLGSTEVVDEVAVQGPVGANTFVVRTVNASVVGGAESYQVDSLPAGSYTLTVTRGAIDVEGNQVVEARSAADVPVVVRPGVTTPADLTVP